MTLFSDSSGGAFIGVIALSRCKGLVDDVFRAVIGSQTDMQSIPVTQLISAPFLLVRAFSPLHLSKLSSFFLHSLYCVASFFPSSVVDTRANSAKSIAGRFSHIASDSDEK